MKNITELSLKNRDLVWYFVIVTFIAGIFSYYRLGRMEDPAFTIRMMVVSAAWPGATAAEMEQQVTDKLGATTCRRRIFARPGATFGISAKT